MPNLIGKTLGRYHILEQIGEGGMATVFKALDTRLERDVAIKIIRTELFGKAIIERILQRFEREAKALARLSHPNILKVLDYGEYKGSPYLVLEYLSGGTLKDKTGQPMPWEQALQLLTPIIQALAYAHEHKIIHRDIKPSNILLTDKGQPLLTDFGIAKILELDDGQTLTGTGVGIGTPEYMAPEQGIGKDVDARADIYAVGIVLYELLTGRKPYTADTPMAVVIKHINDPLPRPGKFVSDLPQSVEKLLIKLLAKKPQDRFSNMDELGLGIKAILANPDTFKLSVPLAEPERNLVTDRSYSPEADENAHTIDLFERSNPVVATESKRPRFQIKDVLPSWWPAVIGGLLLLIGGTIWLNSGIALQIFPTKALVFTSTPTATKTMTPSPSDTPQPTVTPSVTPYPSKIRDSLGVEMVLVPAGEFIMGSDSEMAYGIEQPIHNIYLDTFYVDKYEVSIANYKLCVADGGCSKPLGIRSNSRPDYYDNSEYDNYPVINIEWDMAMAYCNWRGAELPTEAQWEKAARGVDAFTFPWGESFDGSIVNFCDKNCPFDSWKSIDDDDGFGDTAPVDSYPEGVTSYGAYNMAGNVWEYVADFYSETYYAESPSENPQGPTSGEYHVLRGGAWSETSDFVRTTVRVWDNPPNAYWAFGMRCVRDLNP
jgi:eukaryotic-like serine/threonine-protein kinase